MEHSYLIVLEGVLKKIKIFNFFGKAQKRSKLSENDIYIYLRLFPKLVQKYSAKKILWGSKVDEIAFLLVITVLLISQHTE